MALGIIARLLRCFLSTRTFTILLLWLASPTYAVYRSHGDAIDDEFATNAAGLQLESECKMVNTGVPSVKVIEQLQECTKVLREKLEDSKKQRTSSTEANVNYSEQFKHVLGLLKRLRDEQSMKGAFDDGQKQARDFLIAETTKVEDEIQRLQVDSNLVL